MTNLDILRWRKRGTGLLTTYGPAHTPDVRAQHRSNGFYAYCGTFVPNFNTRTSRIHWTDAGENDRRCRECVKGATRDAENPPPRRHPDAPRPNVY